MRRAALALALSLSGCAAATSAARPDQTSGQVAAQPTGTSGQVAAGAPAQTAGTSGQVATAEAPPPPRVPWDQAVAAAAAAVARADIANEYGREIGDKARAAGFDGPALAGLLADLAAHCPAQGACSALSGDRSAVKLVDALGETGDLSHAPLLLRLDALGLYNADSALEDILSRAMADALPKARCAPPSAAELAAARADLADFAVLRQRDDRLVAEPPSAAELDDLAYFFAAVALAGPEVGAAAERPGGGPLQPGPADAERERLADAMNAARLSGDLKAASRHGRAYLQRLGFPGPIDTAAEDTWAWGGARFSYVFRDLARLTEVLGDHALAGRLYRRAQPGGGMCGTSDSYRWEIQVRGAIRSAERQGDCRLALPERLLDVDGATWRDPNEPVDPRDYGPGRLRAAGFDVPRLYRGALLTAGRQHEPAPLQAALATAPEPLRKAALARLARRGTEPWEHRVYAIEGLADTGGRAGLRGLVERLPAVPATERPRLLRAIGAVAERPQWDPCDPRIGGFSGSGSSVWSRSIRSLGQECETSLRLADAGALVPALTPWLASGDPETREAAAEALGKLGHRRALPALRALRRDAYTPAGTQRCSGVGVGCKPIYPVREAADEAIATIAARSRSDARWQRNDPKK